MARTWSDQKLLLAVGAVLFVVGCALPEFSPDADDSVSEVLDDGATSVDSGAGQSVPDGGVAQARVRNESTSRRVDVTVRFIRDDVVVHLAFVRVLPEMTTTVVNSRYIDTVEIYGVDDDGEALANGRFAYGQDFNDAQPVEYVVLDDRVEIDTPVDVEPEVPSPEPEPVPPSELELHEPSRDLVAVIGSTVTARWTDSTARADSVVRLYLRPVSSMVDSARILVSPAIGAALDGENDAAVIVLGNVAAGVYELVAELDDGTGVIRSVAPGRIRVHEPAGDENRAPTLSILAPLPDEEAALTAEDALEVRWTDTDPDDNATITFTLEPTNANDADLGAFSISPPIAEDPDGEFADRAALSLAGVLPGLYDLVGRISDGTLLAVARVERAVRIGRPDEPNQAPTVALASLGPDFDITYGESFVARWSDDDPDNDARITLFLDPDLFADARDMNEIVLVDSISEDDAADEMEVTLPETVPFGEYRLGAVISDGVARMEARASGIVIVVKPNDKGDGDTDEEGDPDDPIDDVRISSFFPTSSPVVTGREPALAIPIDGVSVEGPPAAMMLSNEPFGGTTTVSYSPSTWQIVDDDQLHIAMPHDLVPNRAWPRQFEVTVTLADEAAEVPPSVVWLPQQVELLAATTESYACGSHGELVTETARFQGLTITWFGGGLTAAEPGATIELWLTADGDVPTDGLEDERHRLLWESVGSPNATAMTRIELDTVYDGLPTDARGAPATLLPGAYHLAAVARFDEYGSQAAPSHPRMIEVCSLDAPVRSTDELLEP